MKRPAWIILIGALLALCLLAILLPRPETIDSGQRMIMGTVSKVIVVAKDRAQAIACIEKVFQEQHRIEAVMSFHRADSELSMLNSKAYQGPVEVTTELLELVQKAVQISRLSHGGFDITVGPLVKLWRQAGQSQSLPTDQQIGSVLQKVGYHRLQIDPDHRTIKFLAEGMMLDLGGIAKGYAVDRSIEIARQTGVLGCLVDLGGNIRCFGKAPEGRPYWIVGIQDPCQAGSFGPNAIAMTLRLPDKAVATSGHYYRFQQIQGRSFSHIIDPRTGCPSQALASVTVVAPDATTADAFSTAISVLGLDQGLALARSLPEVAAIIISGRNAGGLEVAMTENAKDLVLQGPRK